MTREWTFTSESVTEGHPDKMADQISDSILDAILAEDPSARVACETMVTTGLAIVAGEITTDAYVEIPSIVRQTLNHSWFAVSEPTRACKPSLTTSVALYCNNEGISALYVCSCA